MTVRTYRRGRVLAIVLDREAKGNALNPEISAGIDAALNELEDDDTLLCAIVTGGTTVFSAGADLAVGPGPRTERGGGVGISHRRRTKPLIAAVEGLALGAGFELILCCDLVVASTTARFGLPEPKHGLIADLGGTFRLSKVLTANVARELLLTGDNLGVERAERLGFVNLITQPGEAMEESFALAERICANAPISIRESLALINDEIYGDESVQWERSDIAHARITDSADFKEGIRAFLDKREPVWSGS